LIIESLLIADWPLLIEGSPPNRNGSMRNQSTIQKSTIINQSLIKDPSNQK